MNTVDNSLYTRQWYEDKIGATKSQQFFWYLVHIIFFVNPFSISSKLKVWILRLFGARVGKGVIIRTGVRIRYPWKLFIGDNSWLEEQVWIDNMANVAIGKNVCISQGAMLQTRTHNQATREFDLMLMTITLEDGVWIGARSVVCPGVTCKTHSVLTVQSVAFHNLEAFTIYQGNPAVAKKERMIQAKKVYKA